MIELWQGLSQQFQGENLVREFVQAVKEEEAKDNGGEIDMDDEGGNGGEGSQNDEASSGDEGGSGDEDIPGTFEFKL